MRVPGLVLMTGVPLKPNLNHKYKPLTKQFPTPLHPCIKTPYWSRAFPIKASGSPIITPIKVDTIKIAANQRVVFTTTSITPGWLSIIRLLPDLLPDLKPDLTLDPPQDLTPDLIPDLIADLIPDLTPDLIPDLIPDLLHVFHDLSLTCDLT